VAGNAPPHGLGLQAFHQPGRRDQRLHAQLNGERLQTLKQLRDAGQTFPIYENGQLAKGSFSQLGALKFHHALKTR
jgi:hypothetical protein